MPKINMADFMRSRAGEVDYRTSYRITLGDAPPIPINHPLALASIALARYAREHSTYEVGEPGAPPYARNLPSRDAAFTNAALARRAGLKPVITRVPPEPPRLFGYREVIL